jgi:hypothetical protein
MKKVLVVMIMFILPHLCEAKDSADLALEKTRIVGNHAAITLTNVAIIKDPVASILKIKDAFERRYPECKATWQIVNWSNDLILLADCK